MERERKIEMRIHRYMERERVISFVKTVAGNVSI
jgi:hypothetical protein